MGEGSKEEVIGKDIRERRKERLESSERIKVFFI